VIPHDDPTFRKRVLRSLGIVLIVGVILAAIFAVFVVRFFANPQSHPFVFLLHGSPSEPPTNYTGIWRTWINGELASEADYAKGRLHGRARDWMDGKLTAEKFYQTGKLNGPYLIFFTNGVIKTTGAYSGEMKVGQWKGFYSDGRPNFEIFFSAPGVPDGAVRTWDTNGSMKILRTYRAGQPWEGKFYLKHTPDWFVEHYHDGNLIARTNLGPRWPPLPGRPAPTNSLKSARSISDTAVEKTR
jgi:hypothetical protein